MKYQECALKSEDNELFLFIKSASQYSNQQLLATDNYSYSRKRLLKENCVLYRKNVGSKEDLVENEEWQENEIPTIENPLLSVHLHGGNFKGKLLLIFASFCSEQSNVIVNLSNRIRLFYRSLIDRHF